MARRRKELMDFGQGGWGGPGAQTEWLALERRDKCFSEQGILVVTWVKSRDGEAISSFLFLNHFIEV